jgi:hypothetical protein
VLCVVMLFCCVVLCVVLTTALPGPHTKRG